MGQLPSDMIFSLSDFFFIRHFITLLIGKFYAGWTQSPGMRFEVGRDNYAGKHVVTVRGHSLNFVVTNGNDGWDTPDPYSGGHKNYYVVNEPGIWRLKGGKVGRLNQ